MENPAAQAGSFEARNDQELITEVNEGDAEAFAALYHRHRDWVTGLAFRFTGDRDLALDVLQETFLYFLKKFPGFQLTAQLRTFLYPAVRNLSIAARRKAGRCQSSAHELELIETAAAPVPMSTDSETLAAALAQFSPEHREVLRLRFVDGLSLEEIGEAMRIPVGTVKSRLHHALKTLREDPATRSFFRVMNLFRTSHT